MTQEETEHLGSPTSFKYFEFIKNFLKEKLQAQIPSFVSSSKYSKEKEKKNKLTQLFSENGGGSLSFITDEIPQC